MSTLADFRTWFDNRVRDAAASFTTAQKDDAIGEAVKAYSKVRPLQAVQDYAGDGITYDLALPTGWETGFSILRGIEYPAGEREPVVLDEEDYGLYQTPSAVKIRLRQTTPASGKTARVTFTKRHVVDATGSTVLAVDEEAVADLAAAFGLRQLAAKFAATVDPTIQADSVDYRSKAREYADLARELEKRYRQHLGLDTESEVPAAAAFGDLDRLDSVGQDHLTHPNRYR